MGLNKITRYQGDTYRIIFNIRRGDSPFDLAGSVVKLSVGPNLPVKPGDVIESMTATSIEDSTATFVISAEIAALAPGNYFAEIEITDVNGEIWTAAQFDWKVKATLA